MRVALQIFVHEHPVQIPLTTRILDSFVRITESRFVTTHQVLVACVLVLCIGIGTSYAAENTLPGDLLYSVKTGINERLQGSFAVSAASKARWTTEIANRRLTEAEELAATGRLTPVASAELESALDDTVQNFDSQVETLADEATIADAQSVLEVSLNAHETVLASIGSASATVEQNLLPIVSKVREHADRVTRARFEAEVRLTAKNDSGIRSAALSKKKSAQEQVISAKKNIRKNSEEKATAPVRNVAEEAAWDVTMGDNDVEKGNWGRAFGAYQAAIRTVLEDKTGEDARDRLKAKLGLELDATSTNPRTSASNSEDGEVHDATSVVQED